MEGARSRGKPLPLGDLVPEIAYPSFTGHWAQPPGHKRQRSAARPNAGTAITVQGGVRDYRGDGCQPQALFFIKLFYDIDFLKIQHTCL